MIKRVLCTIWGHVWEAVIARSRSGGPDYITERCKRCQAWR